MKYLTGVELYYSSPGNISKDEITLSEDEYNHCIKVMRHIIGDDLYITDGKGKIYKTHIEKIVSSKSILTASVKEVISNKNKLENITFCIPRLRSSERLEFAIEKCTELGITNIIIFDSSRTIHKGNRLERWNKILLSAMKQSLLSYLPDLKTIASLEEIKNLDGEKIILEQSAVKHIKELRTEQQKKYFFIFGPEGGLNNEEMELFNKENKYKLADNRLRTETAIIKCAALIST
jgi:16S rRNA (uracil1498-N3)-methyltransferase